MDETTKTIAAGMIRHGLTVAGGSLVTAGVLQPSCAAGVTGCISTSDFVGAGMVLVGLFWSWWQKRGQARMLAVLAKMHPVAASGATEEQAVKAAVTAAKAEMS